MIREKKILGKRNHSWRVLLKKNHLGNPLITMDMPTKMSSEALSNLFRMIRMANLEL
jgi:hypothetical protein